MTLEVQKKYELAICEIYHPVLHGAIDNNDNSDNTITNHFLIYITVELPEFYDNSYKDEERRFQRNRNIEYQQLQLNNSHPTLRNYNHNYNRLEIIELKEFDLYQVALLKTFWLRIVQRCWKRVFKARKELIKKRSSIKALREREQTGLWPLHLREWPQFKLYKEASNYI